MVRTSLVFGGLAGSIVIGISLVIIVLGHEGSLWLGYLVMIFGLSMIFFGIKRHRDGALGGVIKFLPALGLGLAIAVVASLIYMAVWEVYLAATHYTFMDSYVASAIAAAKAKGVSGAALQNEIAQLNAMKESYANRLYRMPMTFMEIFPVGLIIAVISAAVLRNPKVLPARA
ncbi:MAG: DUF4199 domain-containing protein [Proteobacteria bacterium]|nr:DUF4199 domain-containing protein [Pseudomonadota bacterium]